MNRVEIIKANGEKTNFQIEKLIASLRKAGAPTVLATNIATEIQNSLFDGMTTKTIYKKAFSKLRKNSRPSAARYKLKKAIMELGDTGYPFEKFVAALLSTEGYETQVGVVQGHCVTHEVDVIAQNDKHHYMCECKFHNQQGRHCNVKIPLYIQSRFKDVEKAWRKTPGHQTKIHQGWIFTNTRFSSDAMQYGKCMGLKLVSWDYPANDGIKDRIDRSGVHPITCLTTLTSSEKKDLIELDKILCMDLCNSPNLLQKIGVSENRKQKILQEATDLCNK
jgi:Holliday junction resolvase-like predicted endonuclease